MPATHSNKLFCSFAIPSLLLASLVRPMTAAADFDDYHCRFFGVPISVSIHETNGYEYLHLYSLYRRPTGGFWEGQTVYTYPECALYSEHPAGFSGIRFKDNGTGPSRYADRVEFEGKWMYPTDADGHRLDACVCCGG